METLSSPYPVIGFSALVCRQLVYTLTGLLPPPLDDTQEALGARNHAAIAKVAALLPVNANEADLAAQCIAARARVAAPAACVDQRIAENVSENEIDSQGVAFETGLSAQPWNRGATGRGSTRSSKAGLREGARETMALPGLAGRELPANGRESPGRAA